MGYHLGVDLGTTYTAAAVSSGGETRIVELGNRSATIPSVVLLTAEGDLLTGEAANRRAITEPERVAREFKRRIGDPTPLLLGGSPHSAESLSARLLEWVIDHVTEREGGRPDRVAVTHPANWGPYKLDLLHQAVRMANLEEVVTLTEPEAAAIHYSTKERVEPGATVAVFDLGGGTFDAAILRKTASGFDFLGQPEGIERLGGIDFDEAVFAFVTKALGAAYTQLDVSDPNVVAAVSRVRQEAVDAKEALSSDTSVAIPVMLPSTSTTIRLTRAELEQLIRPALSDTIGAMNRAIRGASLQPDEIDVVLLVGGSSRIPLVNQLVRSKLGRPVAVDAHPKHSVALGAAIAAAAGPSGAHLETVDIPVIPPVPSMPGGGDTPTAGGDTPHGDVPGTPNAGGDTRLIAGDPTQPANPSLPPEPPIDAAGATRLVDAHPPVHGSPDGDIQTLGPGSPGVDADRGSFPILDGRDDTNPINQAALTGAAQPTQPAQPTQAVQPPYHHAYDGGGHDNDGPLATPATPSLAGSAPREAGGSSRGRLAVIGVLVALALLFGVVFLPGLLSNDGDGTTAGDETGDGQGDEDQPGEEDPANPDADQDDEDGTGTDDTTDDGTDDQDDDTDDTGDPADTTVPTEDSQEAVTDNSPSTEATPSTEPPFACDPNLLCARIDGVTVDGDQIVIDWAAEGFTPQISSFHGHFYFDIYQPEQVSTTPQGPQAPWEAVQDQPYRTQGDVSMVAIPEGATQICVVAANASHESIDHANANCVDIPEQFLDQ